MTKKNKKVNKKTYLKIFFLVFIILIGIVLVIKNNNEDGEGLGEQGTEFIPAIEVVEIEGSNNLSGESFGSTLEESMVDMMGIMVVIVVAATLLGTVVTFFNRSRSGL